MGHRRAIIDHPLWDRLRAFDKQAARRFPCPGYSGFGRLGLMLEPRRQRYDYWCTPTNVATFAGTGGEGVHFSLLIEDGKVTEASPVVITIPGMFDHPNLIGGASLFDFLCLGFHRGYFALEAFPSPRAFQAYASAKWKPERDADFALGYEVDEDTRPLLDFLIKELGLTPWKDLRRKFQRLQKQHLHRLELPKPDEYFPFSQTGAGAN